ncbi:MAG: succinate dehydrogenase iron-sulfur subunit [Spirochaetes bacterium]|nr:MAG: succinate dehydrogenase iron-sulfur subunit [Spirochaetota bacterium]
MKITLKIKRYNGEKDAQSYFQEFTLEAQPEDRLLDALLAVKTKMDDTLAFRKSCAHGICGSDAMVVNGVERLACKTLIRDVVTAESALITVEPLRSLPVQRDLMVRQDAFFEKFRAVKPFLINDEPAGGRERPQSPEERARFDDTTNCILCAACYSSCPVLRDKDPRFIGPAAIVNAARFLFDSRDRGFAQRLPMLDHEDGVWPCENHFNCTRVCPRGIKVTKNINATKAQIKTFREKDGS